MDNCVELEFDDLEALVREIDGERPGFLEGIRDAGDRAHLLGRLVAIRQALGLTQVAVAERMGTTQSAVSGFEHGGADYYISTAQRYARAIGARLSVSLVDPDLGSLSEIPRTAVRPGNFHCVMTSTSDAALGHPA